MSTTHRHTSGHEHEFEPQHGLPEVLPADERLLWQGSPDWRLLARRAFHVRKLVAYFAALAAIRLAVLLSGGAGGGEMLKAALWMLLLAATAIGLLALVAWLSARGTVYTITDKRIVMRIGIVLTLTFNIPFARIAGAGLRLESNGSGDLPLTLNGQDRIAWLHLWPHARPWRLARPEPMLRCVPQAAAVARLLTDAWSRGTGGTAGAPESPERRSFGGAAAPVHPATTGAGAALPAMAGR